MSGRPLSYPFGDFRSIGGGHPKKYPTGFCSLIKGRYFVDQVLIFSFPKLPSCTVPLCIISFLFKATACSMYRFFCLPFGIKLVIILFCRQHLEPLITILYLTLTVIASFLSTFHISGSSEPITHTDIPRK